MSRQTTLFRTLQCAQMLAEQMNESDIARVLAEAWGVKKQAVHRLIRRLTTTPLSQVQPRQFTPSSRGLWNRTPKMLDRMNQLREAHRQGEQRGETIRRFAEIWKCSECHVQHVYTKMLSEDEA